MSLLFRFIIASLLLAGLILHSAIAASEAHDTDEPLKGQHGGRLLQQDDFALEISIFESGVPPEMRVFSYIGNTAISPEQVELRVTLSRLDGEQNTLQFTPEAEYLLGDAIIAEPHSYAVSVNARYQGKSYSWQYDAFEGRVELNERIVKLSDIQTERASRRVLTQKVHLYGVVAVDPSRQFYVQSPYAGQVRQVMVEPGQHVKKGQVLVELMNTNTLKSFSLRAPADGVVTKRAANPGQVVSNERLLELVDFSQVFVELSAFPADISQIKTGQQVEIFDLHQAATAQSTISFIAPAMTDGHIARIRTVIDNADGFWRPGMHVNADIVVAQQEVAVAVRKSAIQSFRDMAVVFARYGNTFEVRMPEFGIEDDDYIEVISGLKPDTEYATDNSYLLKADVEKDGASHDH